MIPSTCSFKTLKEQNQALLDFSVLCCQAVPSLKGYMKAVEKGSANKIPDADYFKGAPDFARLRAIASCYKKTMGRVMFISLFSYFEAYFKSLIEETINFHGGEESLLVSSNARRREHLDSWRDTEVAKSANKLREYRKKHWDQSYKKHTKILSTTNFRFPSELFATFGIQELCRNYKDLKAVQIIYVAKSCFGVEIDEGEEEIFSQYRDKRNAIAHGDIVVVDFKEALDLSSFLRDLAIKIDNHVLKHFFVIEEGTM